MRLDVEQASFLESFELPPRHRIRRVRDCRRINEQRDWNVVLADERKHIGVNRSVTIVHGDHDAARQRLAALQRGDDGPERNDGMTVIGEILQVTCELRRGDGHRVVDFCFEPVIDEDRYDARPRLIRGGANSSVREDERR